MRFVTHSADETEALGERLAKTLHGGEIIAFTGDLGAGKTAFTRGLARGLGIPMRVTSPTYTIVNEYTGGRLPLFHFDMYRLGSSDELFDIGWEDYLQRGGVCAVEWSENVADAMQGAISVRIGRDSDEQRTIIIEGGGLDADSGILDLGKGGIRRSAGGRRAAWRALSELRPDAQPDAAGIGAASSGDHGADGKGHRRRRLRGGAGQLYRRAHRRGGRQGLCMGAGYPVLRRFDAGGHGMAGIGIFRHRVLRHGRAALAGVSRALPRRERHTDTPVPRLRRFARRGAARTGKLRKTENNGWRWRTVVL